MNQQAVKPELSQQEKDRRWSLLRNRLRQEGLSALIVYGNSQLGVPLHYLTQVWGTKFNMLIFPAEGEPILLIPSNTAQTGALLVSQGCWIPEEQIHPSANPSVDAAKHLFQLNLHREKIGIDSYRFWPVFEQQTFLDLCPDVELVEAHRMFGEIRGPKSDEELSVMAKAIQISDMAHYAFLSHLKPGMTEIDAAAPANDILNANDVSDRIILIHSQPELVYPRAPTRAVIQPSSPVTFSPEFTRRRGYGAQMIRGYWWEQPTGIYLRMFAMWAELRHLIEATFRPGVEITDAARKIEQFVGEHGFECDKLGHGVGLSYGDAPYITAAPNQRDYLEWTILPREVYAVHPMIRVKGGKPPFTMIGDMYFIGEDGTRRMTTTLPGLPEFIPC